VSKILVAYATAAGSTGEIAEAIGQTFREQGAQVDVRRAKEVTDIGGYGAVVLGSGVRAGRLYRDAETFLETYQTALSKIQTAFFIVCGAMKERTEDNCREAESYLDAFLEKAPNIQPVAKGMFAGAIDLARLSWLFRVLLKRVMKEPGGDYRDWDAIRDWAIQTYPALIGD
jgi:menaquinone-dependent protoporphyrinogen oxidase